MRKDVSFISEGLRCAAWLYVPEGASERKPRPAIVMAHGFSALKEMCLPNFAERFERAGFVVLVFDYRFQGGSEGEPRDQIIPHQQHQDYHNAISWVQTQAFVDPQRIGVWGSSYSGAHVLHLAAFDRRIKAVVAQVPLVDGFANAQRLMRSDQLAAFRQALSDDRRARYAGGPVNHAAVVAPEGQPSVLPTPDSYEWFEKVGCKLAPHWPNRVTLESLEYFLEYNPAAHIHLIAPTPLLLIVADNDVLTPVDLALAAYERALQPKSLVLLKGGHFGAYTGDGLEQSAPPAVAWFEKHLL